MAKLTGAQRQRLRDAILDAFSTVDTFDAFMALRVERNRAQITSADGLEIIVFKVIEMAEAEGWTEQLLLSLAEERSQLLPLQKTVQELLVQVQAPEPLWATHSGTPVATLSSAERASLERQLAAQRENLLLIEERMSEFVLPSEAPLQLVKSKRQTVARIAELEERLGLRPSV